MSTLLRSFLLFSYIPFFSHIDPLPFLIFSYLPLTFSSLYCQGRRPDGTLVFTDTTEFTSRLQARLTERARGRAEAAVRAASSEASLLDLQNLADLDERSEQPPGGRGIGSATATATTKSSSARGEGEEEEQDEDENLSMMDIEEHLQKDEDDDEEEDDQMGFVHHQPLASSGNNPYPGIFSGTNAVSPPPPLICNPYLDN